jgi:hypothetical protein
VIRQKHIIYFGFKKELILFFKKIKKNVFCVALLLLIQVYNQIKKFDLGYFYELL